MVTITTFLQVLLIQIPAFIIAVNLLLGLVAILSEHTLNKEELGQ